MYRPGPEVVERSAVRVPDDHSVSFRLQIGLPASGRRIRGHAAIKLLYDDVRSALGNISPDLTLETHVHSIRRQRGIRDALSQHELIAFIENGSILPRQDGVSQNPMKDAVAFQAPSGLNMAIETPWGTAHGLGIRPGVTLIVGGGYHGKSTVLHALSRGHLDHIPGDGREGVVTRTSTVKIRVEEGRHITGVNVSPFLNTLPGGRSTEHFLYEGCIRLYISSCRNC